MAAGGFAGSELCLAGSSRALPLDGFSTTDAGSISMSGMTIGLLIFAGLMALLALRVHVGVGM